MSLLHLLGNSFHDELFRHAVISADGLILAPDDQNLQKFATFLIEQSKDRTRLNYKERKDLVDQVQKLYRYIGRPNEDSIKELLTCLNKLSLHFNANGKLLYEETVPESRYLGPDRPRRSIHERKVAIDKISKRVQKSDMKHLDDWLSRISFTKARMATPTTRTQEEWKEEKFKYIARTQNVWKEMARNRRLNIRKSNLEGKWINAMNRVLDRVRHSHEMIALAADYTSECSSPFRYRPKYRPKSCERRPRSGERAAAAKKNAKAGKLGAAKKDGNKEGRLRDIKIETADDDTPTPDGTDVNAETPPVDDSAAAESSSTFSNAPGDEEEKHEEANEPSGSGKDVTPDAEASAEESKASENIDSEQ